jgi:tetratricopeptide (TPR) repeat protein
MFILRSASSFPLPFFTPTIVRALITPLLLNSLEVPQGDVQTGGAVISFIRPLLQDNFNVEVVLNIPKAMSTLHPLPREELRIDYERGNSYLLMGDFENALTYYNQAEELIFEDQGFKEGNKFYISRGIVKCKLLQWEAAIADFNTANTIYRLFYRWAVLLYL